MVIQEARRVQKVTEYYFSGKLKEIHALRQQGLDIINLGIGSPDLSPDNDPVNALVTTARQPSAHGYQPYIGTPEFRDAIRDYMMEMYGAQFDPNTEILPLMGSKEGIYHIAMSFIDPGDIVLVPNPGYLTYAAASRLAEADIRTYDLNEKDSWRIDFDALKQLPLDDVKIMWVNYPNMPTGSKGDVGQFEKLVTLAQRHQFLIVNDNPYGQLFDGDPLSIFQVENARDVCLELNSLSKSHNMAGWRIGWLAGEFEYLKIVLRSKSNMDSGMFLGFQKAASKALSAEASWYESLRATYEKRRKVGFEILQTLGCEMNPDQQGMFVWGKAPETIDSVPSWVDDILMKTAVFIVPGGIFGTRGDRYVRLSLCSPESVLLEALDRIKKMK